MVKDGSFFSLSSYLFLCCPDLNVPTHTVFTLMLNLLNSFDEAFVKDMPAARETEVGIEFAGDAFPPGVVIFIIDPPPFFFIDGTTVQVFHP